MINETIEQIQERLMLKLKSTPPYDIPNLSPPATALFSKFMDVVGQEIWTLEQLMNEKEAEIEAMIAAVTTPTDQWWVSKILEFQYTTDPLNQQVVKFNTTTFAPYYPVVMPSYRIIKNASAKTQNNNIVLIKVTKGGAILTPDELTAFDAYCETIGPAGVHFEIINQLPDRLWLDADIYYDGQHSNVIKSVVINALNSFLAKIRFDGILLVSDLEVALKQLKEVYDVKINSVAARRITTPFASKTELQRLWQTYSGEIIQEDEPGQTFIDTLNFKVKDE